MKDVLLICGVPGSGKSWVCERLPDFFTYIRHDDYIKADYAQAIELTYQAGKRNIVADCPFKERELREKLEVYGFRVDPIFIVEAPQVVAERYFKREGKQISNASFTRATTIQDRAKEWQAPMGTSQEVLDFLKSLVKTPSDVS